MFTKSTLAKMKKRELIDYCLLLQNNVNNKEVKILRKTKSSFNIIGYNSASGVINSTTDTYTRANLTIHNFEGGNTLTFKVNFFVPNGYGDGSENTLRGEYVVSNNEIIEIEKIGFRKWCIDTFKIPKEISEYNPDFGNVLESILEK